MYVRQSKTNGISFQVGTENTQQQQQLYLHLQYVPLRFSFAWTCKGCVKEAHIHTGEIEATVRVRLRGSVASTVL